MFPLKLKDLTYAVTLHLPEGPRFLLPPPVRFLARVRHHIYPSGGQQRIRQLVVPKRMAAQWRTRRE